jgi:hypothetical protein
MRTDRWTAWVVALLVAGAAVAKAADPPRFVADLAATIRDAGVPAWPDDVAQEAAWCLVVFEAALAVSIVVPRTSRAALAALVAFIGAGVVLVGLASDWGERRGPLCPCGLPFVAPLVRSGFATLLLRDACLVVLVAGAWPRAAVERARDSTAA